jgi:hypothetical protein
MLRSGMCFKWLGTIRVVTKYNTYSNIVTYKCCTIGTVSNSECERVSDIMMLFVNEDDIVDYGSMLWSGMCLNWLGIISVITKYNTYSNIVTYKWCTSRTVSNSTCERVSDIMILVVN